MTVPVLLRWRILFVALWVWIEQLTARGVMNAAALYEPPFSDLHAGGPDELFAGKENVIEGIFDTLRSVQPTTEAATG